MIRYLIQRDRDALQRTIDLCKAARLKFYVNDVNVTSEWEARDAAGVAEYDRLLAEIH